jgi:hypothetical protein
MISDPTLTCLRSKIRLDFAKIRYLWHTVGISKPPATSHMTEDIILNAIFNYMLKYEFS